MNNIKDIRTKSGMTQSQLAEKMGTTYQQIQKLESKDPKALKIGWIKKASKALNVSSAEILGESGSAPAESPQISTESIVAINRKLRRQIAESGKKLTEEQEDLLLTVMLDFAADHPTATAAELTAALTGSLQVAAATALGAPPARKVKKSAAQTD